MICPNPNCKANIPDGSTFCPDCGTPIKDVAAIRDAAREIVAHNTMAYLEAINSGKLSHFLDHCSIEYCEEIISHIPSPPTRSGKGRLKVADKDRSQDIISEAVKLYADGNYDSAIRLWKHAAKEGNAEAQYSLGNCYSDGKLLTVNNKLAFEWYSKAAEQGHAEAQNSVGDAYEYGLGVRKNFKEAAKWYRKAAEQGLVEAQASLAKCYEKGQGVEINPIESERWYRKAADQGCVGVQYHLGECYQVGTFGTKRIKKALECYKLAAEQGHKEAQFKLGFCYESGVGVQINYDTAEKWYELAAQQGHKQAKSHLCGITGRIGILKRKAMEQGDTDALYELGNCYSLGQGMKKNVKTAADYYRKAADKGHAKSQLKLAQCYEDGVGVKACYNKAVALYKKAVEQNIPEAVMCLANCYDKNSKYSLAIPLYTKAATKGNSEAQYQLGVYYEMGLGVSKNLEIAKEWYYKAAQQNHPLAKIRMEELNGISGFFNPHCRRDRSKMLKLRPGIAF